MNKLLLGVRDNEMYLHHTLTENPDKEDFSFKSHSHNMTEIYLFLNGNAKFSIEGRIFDLKRGTIAVMDSGQTHHLLLGESEPYERIAILISRTCMPDEYELICDRLKDGKNIFILSEEEISWFVNSIYTAKKLPSATQKTLILSFCRLLFAKLYGKEAVELPENESSDDLIVQAIEYLNRHLGDKALNLDMIVSALFTNKVNLNRKFRSVMGYSVWEYVIKRRVFSAQQEIIFTNSITKAFEMSGFSDYSSFWRAYKKYIGVTPKEDLKKIRM